MICALRSTARLGLAAALVLSFEPAHSAKPTFTVRDAIAMTTFSDPSGRRPGGVASASPDGRFFYAVTTRGILGVNKVESTLWLFPAQSVRCYLNSFRSSPPPATVAARIAAVPRMFSAQPYASMITDVRWSPDSKKIYFRGEDSDGEKRLYEVDLARGTLRALTPPGYGVQQFDFAKGTIVYTANRTGQKADGIPWSRANAVNADAGAVTGMGLEDILRFPEEGHGMGSARELADLWIGREGRPFERVETQGASRSPVPDVEHSLNVLSLGPDGHSVIRLLPVDEIPEAWSAYNPKPGFESWRISPQDRFLVEPTYWYRLREYMLIDTRTGAEKPLIAAPNGDTLAEEDMSAAIWSRDGRRVLLGNVALPLEGVDPSERLQRRQVCALASVDLPSLATKCIAFTRDATVVIDPSNPRPLRVVSARFDASDDQVIISLAWHGKWGQTEKYQLVDGRWQLARTTPGDPFTGQPLDDADGARTTGLRLVVRQDLNTPPALWAEDPVTGHAKPLWDPNPALAHKQLGRARMYEWTDPSGYRWKGILVLPPNFEAGKRYPLVIQTHGFLDFAFLSDGMYPTAEAARPLAAEGMLVLQTTGRPDHYDTDKEAHDENVGWKAAIDQLAKDGLVDRARVGIAGFSRTCWQVEQALISDPELYRAAVVADGLDDSYMTYWLFAEGRPSMAKGYEKIIGSAPLGDGLERWVRQAPGFHLDKVMTPVRIEAIGPSSILTEWETYAALRRQKKPVDLIYIPAGQHVLEKPLDRLASQQGTVDWFRFWLQDREDPDAAKRAQFMRWRDMRHREEERKIEWGDEVPSPPQG